jgi:hypothetical protein
MAALHIPGSGIKVQRSLLLQFFLQENITCPVKTAMIIDFFMG